MEHKKILNLLNEASDSKFMTRKWNIFNDQSYENHDVGNEIIEVLNSNLCDYNDAYNLVRGNATIAGNIAVRVGFKNCAPFTNCMIKIDGTAIGNAEDLDLVMPMYTLLEYNSIILTRQVVYGYIPKMKQLFLIILLQLMTMILNFLSIKLN